MWSTGRFVDCILFVSSKFEFECLLGRALRSVYVLPYNRSARPGYLPGPLNASVERDGHMGTAGGLFFVFTFHFYTLSKHDFMT